jgi:hypothetical protein
MLLFRLPLLTLVLLVALQLHLPVATAAPVEGCTWEAWGQTYDFSSVEQGGAGRGTERNGGRAS